MKTSTDAPPAHTAAAQQIIDRVEAVAAELEAEGAPSEQLGKLTPKAIELLLSTGVTRCLLPADYGGDALMPGEALPILERVAYIDGSVGWIGTILASAGHIMSYFQPDAARELLADGLPLFAVSGAPNGKATPVEGGYRFSGSYSYSSGGLHADYVFCHGFVMDGDAFALGANGKPRLLMFLVPRAEVVQTGNWDTLGLRGTGSVDFSVTDVFVPADRAIALFGPAVVGGPETKGGFSILIQLMHLGFATGITRRLLDEMKKHATKPSSRPGGSALVDTERFRIEYAKYDLAALASRELVASTWNSLDDTLRAGQTPSRRQVSLLRGSSLAVHDLARDIANWAYRRGGGTSLRQGTLQRAIRDTLAGTQHAIVDESHYAQIGWELLDAPADLVWAGNELVPAVGSH